MDREQQGLSRRDLFRNAAAAGIGLPALLDLLGASGLGIHAEDRCATDREARGTNHHHGSRQVPQELQGSAAAGRAGEGRQAAAGQERIGEDPLVIKPVA